MDAFRQLAEAVRVWHPSGLRRFLRPDLGGVSAARLGAELLKRKGRAYSTGSSAGEFNGPVVRYRSELRTIKEDAELEPASRNMTVLHVEVSVGLVTGAVFLKDFSCEDATDEVLAASEKRIAGYARRGAAATTRLERFRCLFYIAHEHCLVGRFHEAFEAYETLLSEDWLAAHPGWPKVRSLIVGGMHRAMLHVEVPSRYRRLRALIASNALTRDCRP
jgi:ribosome-binding factor A